MRLENLKPRYDYSKEDSYITLIHQIKPSQTKEINIDWFDYNFGEKVIWLLIRVHQGNINEKPKYRNIKLRNVDKNVKFTKKK